MIDAFVRAGFDLFKPRILIFVLLLPFLALLLWAGVGYFSFESLSGFLAQATRAWGFAEGAAGPVAAVLMVILAIPLIYWTALGLMAVFALPVILRTLKPRYPGLPESGLSLRSSLGLALKMFLFLVPIYFVLVVLFWIPLVFMVGTLVIGAWANAYFLSLEILGEFTDQATIERLTKAHQTETWIMGGLLMLLLSVPVLGLLTPVFGGLWFSHFWMNRLSQSR